MAKRRKRDVFPRTVAVSYDGEGDQRVMWVDELVESHADQKGWKDVGIYRLVRRVKTKTELVTRIRKD
jgi:hypothetical protein